MSYYIKNNMFENATKWRNALKSLFSRHSIGYFDPCECFRENQYIDKKGIVDQNNHYLRQCDLMIVNFDHILDSPGTLYEMFNFSFQRKPVIGFGPFYMKGQYAHIDYALSEYIETNEDFVSQDSDVNCDIVYQNIVDYILNMYFQ